MPLLVACKALLKWFIFAYFHRVLADLQQVHLCFTCGLALLRLNLILQFLIESQ